MFQAWFLVTCLLKVWGFFYSFIYWKEKNKLLSDNTFFTYSIRKSRLTLNIYSHIDSHQQIIFISDQLLKSLIKKHPKDKNTSFKLSHIVYINFIEHILSSISMQGPLCNEYTLHDQIISPEFEISVDIQNHSVNHSHLSPTASIFVSNTTSHLYFHLHNVRWEKFVRQIVIHISTLGARSP